MANLTILEALNRSLTATKKYVDNKVPHYNETLKLEISGADFKSLTTNNYFNVNALNIDETKLYVGKVKMDINSDEENIYKLVYDKTNNALIDEISQTYIYNHKSYDGTNFTDDVNSAVITLGITPMSAVLEVEGYFKLYEVEKVELDNNCLSDNVSIKNSLTVGKRLGDIGQYSVSEGVDTTASGYISHAEGDSTTASGNVSHAEGSYTTASGNFSHAEGDFTTASGERSHAEGDSTTASGTSSHAEGAYTIASGNISHAEGGYTTASGENSHAEGASSNSISAVISDFSPSTSNDVILTAWNNGQFSLAKGNASHVEGRNCLALGDFSHAEGNLTTASGDISHAEGYSTKATGNSSHAEGVGSIASGMCSHAEGIGSTASGMCSHAEGDNTTASGEYSHAEGDRTIASSENQHVQGKYNIEDTENKYAHIVGNGTADNARSNAHTLDWQGNAWYQGKLSQDGIPTEDKDLVTKKYVDENFLPNSAIHTMTLKLNTNELNFIQSMVTNNYNRALEHITKGDLSSIIDNSIETIIFEGLERYPYKVVGAYRGFSNNERVLLELAIGDSSENYYAVHRLKINYSDDFSGCFLSSFYGDLAKINALAIDNTREYIPTGDYNPATKKYVDDKVAEANASGGYTHPDSHPASMITGLATVATSGSYNDLNDKPTIPDVSDKANISGQVFTGAIEAPTVIASTYFRTPALVGEGDNSAYYHRVNFGYRNHDYWEFHEYGGDYRFYENKNGTAAGGTMIANIKSTYSDFKGEVRENGTRVYSPNNKPTADDLGITIPSIDGLATETYVNNKVAGLIDSAPEALNTLNELATALGNDANFATTISNQIGLKANSADLATVATSGSYNDLSDKPTIPAAYTHPASHPASMITGLHTVATSGSYNDLNNKPITILTAAENEIIILSELAVGAYFITGLVKYVSTDTAPQPFNNSFVEVFKNGSITYVADPFNVSVIDSNSIEVAPRVNVQADWNTVDETNPTYINNKPTIPTVTNDLTNELKANYDAAYAHSQAAHAPSNAQKNSDITKSEIEAKLTGNITTHTHSQYLTSIPNEYITETELNAKGYLTEHQDISGLAPKANPSFTGNMTVAGKVTVGTAPTENMDVATKQYVDDAVANGGGTSSGSAADYGPYSIQYNSVNNRLEFIYTPTN